MSEEAHTDAPRSPWVDVFDHCPPGPAPHPTIIVPTIIAPGHLAVARWEDEGYVLMGRRHAVGGEEAVARTAGYVSVTIPLLGDAAKVLDVVGRAYRKADELREEARQVEHSIDEWLRTFPYPWAEGNPDPVNEVQIR